MQHERLLVVVLLTLVLSMQAARSPAATAACGLGGRPHPFLTLPRSPAVTGTAAAAPQTPAAVEASLDLDRSTRLLIQQGLQNEGFDPGIPDGLFGPRTRGAIRDWQRSRGAPSTGYLNGAEAELLSMAALPPPVSAAAPLPQTVPATTPNALFAATSPPASPAQADPTGSAQPELPTNRHQPQPGRTPAARATAPTQLPPDILLDSHLLRAEQSVREDHHTGARAAMAQIDALQADHELPTPPDYHYRYARIWSAVANWERSQASAVRYLELTGREGEHYLDALTLMNQAITKLEEIARERARLAAEEASRRAAAARARAELERATNAARGVLAQMQFVAIPPGRFLMGTNSSDEWWLGGPRTEVRITRPFELGRYEVTQAEWEAVMGSLPSILAHECARCPVDFLTWETIQRFIALLNAAAGDNHQYRLPTEAEWEYAARAGQSGDRYTRDLDASAWCRRNSGDRTHPVGLKRPNEFGLYDMLGNVSEVVQDWWGRYPGGTVADPVGPPSSSSSDPDKVARGASYSASFTFCQRAGRDFFTTAGVFGNPSAGLRLVRSER